MNSDRRRLRLIWLMAAGQISDDNAVVCGGGTRGRGAVVLGSRLRDLFSSFLFALSPSLFLSFWLLFFFYLKPIFIFVLLLFFSFFLCSGLAERSGRPWCVVL
jgi:hypothetical protein